VPQLEDKYLILHTLAVIKYWNHPIIRKTIIHLIKLVH